MTDPLIVGAAGTVLVVGAAAVYAHLTGGEASVDVDDGEVTFGDDDQCESADTGSDTQDVSDDMEANVPASVTSKDGLVDVKGIQETRAEKLETNGIKTVEDLYLTADSTLTNINGIGDATVGMIREDIGDPESGNVESDESGGSEQSSQ